MTTTGVPVVVQQTEIDYGLEKGSTGTEVDVAYHRHNYLDETTRWQTVTGDTEIAPGVSVIFTPGHTGPPFHQR